MAFSTTTSKTTTTSAKEAMTIVTSNNNSTTSKVQTGNLYQMVNVNMNGVLKNVMIPVGTKNAVNANPLKGCLRGGQPRVRSIMQTVNPTIIQHSGGMQQTPQLQQPSRFVIIRQSHRPSSNQSALINSTTSVNRVQRPIIVRPATGTSVATGGISLPTNITNTAAPAPVIYMTQKARAPQTAIRIEQPQSKQPVPLQPVGKMLLRPSGLVSHIPKPSSTSTLNDPSVVTIRVPQESINQQKNYCHSDKQAMKIDSVYSLAESHDSSESQRISPINICPCDDDQVNDGTVNEENSSLTCDNDDDTSVIHGDNMQVRIAGEVVRQLQESGDKETDSSGVVVVAEWDKEDAVTPGTPDTCTSPLLVSTRQQKPCKRNNRTKGTVMIDKTIEKYPTELSISANTMKCRNSEHIDDSTKSIKKCSVMLERLDPKIKVPVDVNLFESFCRSEANTRSMADQPSKKSRRKQPKPRCISKNASSLSISQGADRATLIKKPITQSLLNTVTNLTSNTLTNISSSPNSLLKRNSSQMLSAVSTTTSKPNQTSGRDKTKFLMIKTNAGTFLVPMAATKSGTSAVKMASPITINKDKTNVGEKQPTKKNTGTVLYKSILPKLHANSDSSKVRIKTETPTAGYADDAIVIKENYNGPPEKCPKLSDDSSVMTLSSSKSSDKIKELKEKLKQQEALVNALRRKRSNDSDNSGTNT